MAHKYEILDIRDRYMIGDWVLKDGKPYRWTELDYNRGVKGMEIIKPIPLTEEFVRSIGFYGTTEYNQLRYGNVFIMCCYNDKPYCPPYKVYGCIECEYVHELQAAFRVCKLYNLAERIKI